MPLASAVTLPPARPEVAPLHTVEEVRAAVLEAVRLTPVLDIHTHLCPPAFGGLLLWGVDDLLTYHYLIAEVMRCFPQAHGQRLTVQQVYAMSKQDQAQLVWDHLFCARTPLSEACRGVVTTLSRLGLDLRQRDLPLLRTWFAQRRPEDYIDRVFELSGVHTLIMTNVPFDPAEKPVWDAGYDVSQDPRFLGVLRIDPIVRFWDKPTSGGCAQLRGWGYDVTPELTPRSVSECRRFLDDWMGKVSAEYVACSLPPSFRFPGEDEASRVTEAVLRQCVLPACAQRGIPFAMMIGSKLQVNPSYGLAGDAVGKSDVSAVEAICREFPQNKLLVTMLSRENQHELCVLARKFANLHVFGCWWFLNNPSIIDEMTRMRLELLGLSVTPQHSDARVLDQLIYKWDHSRAIIGAALADKFADLHQAGWQVTRDEVQRDVRRLFGGSFQDFLRS